MRWAEITLEVPSSSVEPASAALTEIGSAGVAIADPAAVSSDPFADWADLPRGEHSSRGSLCRVSGYLPVDDRLEGALTDLERRLDLLRDAGIPAGDGVVLRTLDDESWAAAWKEYFKPLRVGRRFVVKPTWEDFAAAPGDRVIEIDPGMAFGTGSHPTTRLCLELLEELVQGGERALDWGTGSGILAIAAARLGARSVLALDLDPLAVRVAGENVRQNDLADVVAVSEASIEDLGDPEGFDIVIANIVADPIIAHAADILARLRPGGSTLVSGIIDQREESVIAALQSAGLRISRAASEDDWRAIVAVRPP